MIYYGSCTAGWLFIVKNLKNQGTKPVSVIICAKNEYQNLLHNLPVVLEQDYPDFEVIVVNDASDDDSIGIAQFSCQEV